MKFANIRAGQLPRLWWTRSLTLTAHGFDGGCCRNGRGALAVDRLKSLLPRSNQKECKMNGLYTGFEAHRIPREADIPRALKEGLVAIDTNVLLNLYRYNEKTVEDILDVLAAVSDRLFVPHQVVREFWRNRQKVIKSRGSVTRNAQQALEKNRTSTMNAIITWAQATALKSEEQQTLVREVGQFFDDLKSKIGSEPSRQASNRMMAQDRVLDRLETMLEGSVGGELDSDEWENAVAEGERRVAESIPPGYMDIEKLESDWPEGASGDYLVWYQLMGEGTARDADVVLVTSDTKEDWWNKVDGQLIGPRHELVEEYLRLSGRRFYLLEPLQLIRHADILGVNTAPESLDDIQRVRDEEPPRTMWTIDAVKAVLTRLDVEERTQAKVIRRAIERGGRVARDYVYELEGRDESQTLRGYTKPVLRVTASLQEVGAVPEGVVPLLNAVYDSGVRTSHFSVPPEVPELFDGNVDG